MNPSDKNVEEALWAEFGQYLQMISTQFTASLDETSKQCVDAIANTFNTRMQQSKQIYSQHESAFQASIQQIRLFGQELEQRTVGLLEQTSRELKVTKWLAVASLSLNFLVICAVAIAIVLQKS